MCPPVRKSPKSRAIRSRSGGQRRKDFPAVHFLPISPASPPAAAKARGEKRSLLPSGSFVNRISIDERNKIARSEKRQMEKPIKRLPMGVLCFVFFFGFIA